MRIHQLLPIGLCALSLAIAWQAGGTAQSPTAAATPKQTEKERIEREIQGVWEVTQCNNPKLAPIVRASGFMIIYDRWLSVNIVVTTKDKTFNNWVYNFVGSAKTYTITDANRMRLVDVWGYSNAKGDLAPDVNGTAEERMIQFVGPPEIGQKLTISRGGNDSMTFVRRALPPKATTPPVANDK